MHLLPGGKGETVAGSGFVLCMSPPEAGWVPGNPFDGVTTENIKVSERRLGEVIGGVTLGYQSSIVNMPAPLTKAMHPRLASHSPDSFSVIQALILSLLGPYFPDLPVFKTPFISWGSAVRGRCPFRARAARGLGIS